MLRGTGVSEGCGIGKALIIQHRSLDYSGVVFGGAQQEKERLRAAIDAFMQKTEQLRDRLQASAGEKEAAILDGHMEMLRDPFMLSQMEEMIDGGATAEAAADGVCNQFIAMFSGMDDELTRQRASDIADVREDLLGIMLGAEQVDLGAIEPGTVLVAHDFTPSMTGKMNREHVAAIVAEVGGMTSHSAILARAMGIPAVLSVSGAVEALHTGQCVAVDGFRGTVLPEPTPEQTAEFKRRQREYLAEREALSRYCNLPTVTKNGVKKAVYGNIGKPEDVQAVVQNGGEGIGLFRTEFLFMDRMSRPTEAEQFEAYATVAKAMNGREVIIRTLDIGGDKEIPYLEIEKEDNPFLGHRAIRYCLDHPDLFCDQIRAILRAAKFGDLKLMLPLITCKEEILAAKKLIEQCLRELIEAGEDVHPVPVGIMVETPAAALTAAELAKEADFFSIGTNDLTGYVMAVDRGNQAVARLYDPIQPAVLSAIEMTIKAAKAAGIPLIEGNIHSADVFYRQPSDEKPTYWEKLRDERGCLCVEMESFALFANARVLGKHAACLLTISDSFVAPEITTAEQRQTSFTNMMKVALGAEY